MAKHFNVESQRCSLFPFTFCLSYSYEEVKKISDFLLSKTAHRPKVGIVCGSGLGGLVDGLEQQESFPYENIPGFPVSTGRDKV